MLNYVFKKHKGVGYHWISCLLIFACLILFTPGSVNIAYADTSGSYATSTGYRYNEAVYNKTVSKYSEIMNILTNEGNVPIPGLEQTVVRMWGSSNELSDSICNDMVPQGLCVTGKYILVTAYCCKNKKTGSGHEHPSVIYVIDRASGKYLCNLTLYYGDSTPHITEFTHSDFSTYTYSSAHVGGIAFDGNDTVWVSAGEKNVRSLLISQINEAVNKAFDEETNARCRDSIAVTLGKKVLCEDQASFLTWYEGMLWVGTCNDSSKGCLKGYTISGDDTGYVIEKKRTFTIVSKANGASFCNINGRTCLAVNSSERRKDGLFAPNYVSRMYLYEANIQGTTELTEHGYYTMPPMAEEIAVDGGKLYTIFESAASIYSAGGKETADYIIDRICIGNAKKFFYWTEPEFNLETDDGTLGEGADFSGSLVFDNVDMLEGAHGINCTFGNVSIGTFTTNFMYSDSMLLESAYRASGEPDPEIAKVSVCLAAAAYDSSNAVTALRTMGYSKINWYNYGRTATYYDNDFVGFSIAEKKVSVYGNIYTLYVVPIRGTPTSAEWYSNFNVGMGDTHEGFYKAANEVLSTLINDFFSRDGSDASHRKILITGHSRGAAVANIVAGKLTEGGGTYVNTEGIFGYTYACPAVSKNAATSYKNIYNFQFSGDPIPELPLPKWSFIRYGQSIILGSDKEDSGNVNFQNVAIQFNRMTGKTFKGTQGAGSTFRTNFEEVVRSQEDYNNPEILGLLDIVAYELGGKNAPKDKDATVGIFLAKQWKRLKSYAKSEFDDSDSYSDVLQKSEKYESEFVKLIDDAIKAEQESNEEFDKFVTKNSNLIEKLEKYTDMTIEKMEDFNVAINLVEEQLNEIRTVIAAINTIINLFLINKNPIDAIVYGHTPETYVLFINSMYSGYRGWYERNDITSIHFPSGLKTIGYQCYANCTGLTSVIMPNEMTALGDYAFNGCSGVKKITMPVDLAYGTFGSTGAEEIHYTKGSTGIMSDRVDNNNYGAYYVNKAEWGARGTLT